MSKYEIIIYWSEEDRAFIAEVPELAGCMAAGETYREALANAEIIIQEWIETAKELGRKAPEPKGRLVFACEINMRETSVVYDKDLKKQLKKEEKRATKLLKGKVIKRICRNRKEEILIDFEDGTRFFIDWRKDELDLSITGNFEEDE